MTFNDFTINTNLENVINDLINEEEDTLHRYFTSFVIRCIDIWNNNISPGIGLAIGYPYSDRNIRLWLDSIGWTKKDDEKKVMCILELDSITEERNNSIVPEANPIYDVTDIISYRWNFYYPILFENYEQYLTSNEIMIKVLFNLHKLLKLLGHYIVINNCRYARVMKAFEFNNKDTVFSQILDINCVVYTGITQFAITKTIPIGSKLL